MSSTILAQNDLFSVQAVDYAEGMISVSFVIPADLLPSVKSFLEFSNSLFRYASTRAKFKKSIVDATSADALRVREESQDKFTAAIVSRYRDHILSGMASRPAMREIRDHFVGRGSHLTCYQVELMLRAAGCLSKKWVPHV